MVALVLLAASLLAACHGKSVGHAVVADDACAGRGVEQCSLSALQLRSEFRGDRVAVETGLTPTAGLQLRYTPEMAPLLAKWAAAESDRKMLERLLSAADRARSERRDLVRLVLRRWDEILKNRDKTVIPTTPEETEFFAMTMQDDLQMKYMGRDCRGLLFGGGEISSAASCKEAVRLFLGDVADIEGSEDWFEYDDSGCVLVISVDGSAAFPMKFGRVEPNAVNRARFCIVRDAEGYRIHRPDTEWE